MGEDMTDVAAEAAPDLLTQTSAIDRSFAWSPLAKPLSTVGNWLKGGLYLFIIGQVMNVLLLAVLLWVFQILATGGAIDENTAAIAGMTASTAQMLPAVSIAIFVLCVILYLWFVYRAIKNLQLSKARGLSVSPGDAVGMSFIPIVNFIAIFQVMKEIWAASTNPVKGDQPTPMRLRLWWGLWLAGNLTTLASNSMVPPGLGEDPVLFFDLFSPGAVLQIIASATVITSTVILHSIIGEIVRAQDLLRSTTVFED
jgi:hypothetical protein